MNKIILFTCLALAFWGCGVTRIPEPPEEVHMRMIRHKKDTVLRAGHRYVFSRKPCDSVILTNIRGKLVPMWNEKTDTNKAF